jgi:hypothetical protein
MDQWGQDFVDAEVEGFFEYGSDNQGSFQFGYEEFLEAMADPKHEQHDDFVQWSDGSFSPEEFDSKEATKHMRRGLPDWRQHQ